VQVDESLRIETPEQIALELPIAGVGSRFLALAVDTLLQLFVGTIGAFALAIVLPLALSVAPDWLRMLGPAVAIFFLYAIYWGYFAVFEIVTSGRTPGKRVAGIRVIKDNGRPLRAYEAIARNFLRVIDFLPAMYAFGVITMLLNRNSKRLGDFVAGTIVVHDKPLDIVATDWGTTLTAAETIGAHQAAQITAQELVLVESFLRRRLELDPLVGDDMAAQIVRRIGDRAGTPPPGMTNVEFLESLAARVRDTARFR